MKDIDACHNCKYPSHFQAETYLNKAKDLRHAVLKGLLRRRFKRVVYTDRRLKTAPFVKKMQ